HQWPQPLAQAPAASSGPRGQARGPLFLRRSIFLRLLRRDFAKNFFYFFYLSRLDLQLVVDVVVGKSERVELGSLLLRERGFGGAAHVCPRRDCNAGVVSVASGSCSPPAREPVRGSRSALSLAGLDALRARTHAHSRRRRGGCGAICCHRP